MRKPIIIWGLLLACMSAVFAQNVTRIEYFIDTDPGFGLGTPVSFTPVVSVNNLTFNVNVASLTSGFHTLYVRSKNAAGVWGITHNTILYKNTSVAADPSSNINRLEYFIDTDPGFGNGTNVPITPAASINQVFSVPVNSVADGFHTLYVRSRANGKWSVTHNTVFYKVPALVNAPLPNLKRLEYFVDTDPGEGNGTTIPFTTGTSVSNLVFDVSTTSLSVGTHKLYIRAKDTRDGWSVVAISDFNVCNHPGTTINTATSITSSGFTASWQEVPGSVSYQLDVSTDNFNSFVSGYNAKVITAPASSSVVTGLTQASTYQYRVRAVASCASVQSNTVSLTTLAASPAAQPTNLLFSSVTPTSFTAFFTAPGTAPTGYLVVRKVGASPTFVPVVNTSYTLGQTVGDGVVAYVGPATLFNETGLLPNTRYYYDVFSYNQVSSFYTYLTTSPLENNVFTLATEPTAQPTALTFSSVTDVGLTASFTAAAGSPSGYLALRKVGSTPTSIPADGVSYTTTVGTDAVAYQGSATTFAQSGLIQNTDYHFAIYSFNGSGTSINYLTASPLLGNQLTPIITPTSAPTNLVFSGVTESSITVSYSSPAISPTGYLVVRKEGSNPSFVPQLNTAYTLGQVLPDGIVAYVGPSLSFTDNSLSASTIYFYDVFAFNQSGSLYSYQIVPPLEGSKSTFTAEPLAQPSSLTFSSITATSVTLSFTAATPVPSGYLVLRKAGSAPTALPVDGTPYTLGQALGDGTVAYVGATTTLVDSGLLSGTTYFYQVFSYNGSAGATNYLTTVSSGNSGSKITIPAKPVLGDATGVQQTQFTISWTAVTGADAYRLDVSKDSFVTRITGFDNLSVTGTSTQVTGLEPGIAYKYRLRAENTSGTSANADEVQQFTVPATPTLAAATLVDQTGFTANWNSVTGATGYFLDVSLLNDFTTTVSGYQNKSLGIVTSATITGLTPGTVYFYRVRSSNSGGDSPDITPPGSQLLLPATPLGLDATNTQPTSFKAKWQAVPAVTEYRLDVSLAADNFNPSLAAYNNKLIDAALTEELIVGLIPNTAYRYRVRAVNGSGASPSSVPISVSTAESGTGVALELSNLVYSSVFSVTSTASVEVKGGTPPYAVSFQYRKIAGGDVTVRTLTSSGTTYQTTIDASMMDELGLEFTFKVTDVNGTLEESNKNFIRRAIPAGSEIPFSKFGGTDESYTIFSIPYKLNDNDIRSLFEPVLGAYNKKKWRLVRYQNGDNVDYTNGISKIEQGKGYWFNSKEEVVIGISEGTVPDVNDGKPFTLQLEKGWNQIGNPYPFNVDWEDVKAANLSVADKLSDYHVFNASALHLNDKSPSLVPFSGGFVFIDSAVPILIDFPVSLKLAAGGKKANEKRENHLIDQENWIVPIHIQLNDFEVRAATIGMHTQASLSKDKFDEIIPPRFLNYIELSSLHEEYFSPQFSKDVVPPAEQFSWDFTFETNVAAKKAELTWPAEALGNGAAQLVLVDLSNNQWINMKNKGSYLFEVRKNHQFRIVFSKDSEHLDPAITFLGNPYPNPFNNQTTIPFAVSENQTAVKITIRNMLGSEVAVPVQGIFSLGLHESLWDGRDSQGDFVAAGIYLCQLEVNGFLFTTRIIKH